MEGDSVLLFNKVSEAETDTEWKKYSDIYSIWSL